MVDTVNDLKIKLLSFISSAKYNVFSQISLHQYFKFTYKNKVKPYGLPHLILLEGKKQSLDDFVDEMDSISSHALLNAKRNANDFITRNLLKEVFRLTQAYCYNSKQENKLITQGWYEFARMHVNSLSHDFKFIFEKKDKKILCKKIVEYKSENITLEMDGKLSPLSLQIAYELSMDIFNFVKNELH